MERKMIILPPKRAAPPAPNFCFTWPFRGGKMLLTALLAMNLSLMLHSWGHVVITDRLIC